LEKLKKSTKIPGGAPRIPDTRHGEETSEARDAVIVHKPTQPELTKGEKHEKDYGKRTRKGIYVLSNFLDTKWKSRQTSVEAKDIKKEGSRRIKAPGEGPMDEKRPLPGEKRSPGMSSSVQNPKKGRRTGGLGITPKRGEGYVKRKTVSQCELIKANWVPSRLSLDKKGVHDQFSEREGTEKGGKRTVRKKKKKKKKKPNGEPCPAAPPTYARWGLKDEKRYGRQGYLNRDLKKHRKNP